MAISDVKALAKAGTSDDAIINQMVSSHTVFHLSAADIIDLKNAGVSNKVINFMINSQASLGSSATTTGNATVAPANAYITDQAPPAPATVPATVSPGPNYVWIDGEWVWSGGGWLWVAGHWDYPPAPHEVWVVGRTWHDGYGWHNMRGHWR